MIREGPQYSSFQPFRVLSRLPLPSPGPRRRKVNRCQSDKLLHLFLFWLFFSLLSSSLTPVYALFVLFPSLTLRESLTIAKFESHSVCQSHLLCAEAKAMANAKLHLAEPSPHSSASPVAPSSQEARKRRAATQQAAPPGLAKAPTANLLDWIRGGFGEQDWQMGGAWPGRAHFLSILNLFFSFFANLRVCVHTVIRTYSYLRTCVPIRTLAVVHSALHFQRRISYTQTFFFFFTFLLALFIPFIVIYILTTCLIAMYTATPSRIQTRLVPTPLFTV